ncbi:glutamate synthase (NADPH/NADH) small chain [Pullulanibacillus pueri]|uniref:Glutamate synthase [NADPH] small chain n=1 Tax=Pullulanibacillus pueri TaxID=1437324 RepID=A0A8J2ZSY8_9BACL|nr:glutamate synthase subunit beta [Pullulanibacillus pueri]MBM7680373.1 glutamate synthase (NADPH/NADH) small chain [Pullulanibacillus pueri]GGH75392.1 glutamate synthase [NADPH] small chain [Pullulanibacillus pueri]
MGKLTGFLDYKRKETKERSPRERLRDWQEYQKAWSDETLKQQGARCMDCSTPYCHIGVEFNQTSFGCPLHNLIPEWNDLVYRGQWKEALHRLLKTNNFPEWTGRVCPAPCEGSCTVSLNDDAVTIKNIEKSIIDKGFAEGWIVPEPPEHRTGKHVAIIGSGPAGLAAADQLNKAGHWVTVFEREDRVGGLLMYGIPNMKLEKESVTRRVDLLRQEGVIFQVNTEVGKDISMQQLEDKFDAVIVCAGATKQRDVDIPGREAKGIQYAMDYLTMSTKVLLDPTLELPEAFSAKDKNVIVIGGGDTGADCVATALRQGSKSIVQFGKHPKLPKYRLETNPWPEQPDVFELSYAYKEAKAQSGQDPRQYSILTQRFITDEKGHIVALETMEVEKDTNEKGEVVTQEIPGTEKLWPVDLVLIAVGFEGPEKSLLNHLGLTQTYRGTVKAKYGEYTTNKDGVFAAGDVRRGQSLIVWAINEGREAARECDRYLMGATVLP